MRGRTAGQVHRQLQLAVLPEAVSVREEAPRVGVVRCRYVDVDVAKRTREVRQRAGCVRPESSDRDVLEASLLQCLKYELGVREPGLAARAQTRHVLFGRRGRLGRHHRAGLRLGHAPVQDRFELMGHRGRQGMVPVRRTRTDEQRWFLVGHACVGGEPQQLVLWTTKRHLRLPP